MSLKGHSDFIKTSELLKDTNWHDNRTFQLKICNKNLNCNSAELWCPFSSPSCSYLPRAEADLGLALLRGTSPAAYWVWSISSSLSRFSVSPLWCQNILIPLIMFIRWLWLTSVSQQGRKWESYRHLNFCVICFPVAGS